MSNPTRTSLLAVAVNDGVKYVPLAIAPLAEIVGENVFCPVMVSAPVK